MEQMEGACGDAVEFQSVTEIDKVSAGSCAGQRVSVKSMPLTVANLRTLHVHIACVSPETRTLCSLRLICCCTWMASI